MLVKILWEATKVYSAPTAFIKFVYGKDSHAIVVTKYFDNKFVSFAVYSNGVVSLMRVVIIQWTGPLES